MSQNVSRCPKMSKNVEKCPSRLWEKMVGNDWENRLKCPNSSKSLPNCPKMFQVVPKCPKMSQNAHFRRIVVRTDLLSFKTNGMQIWDHTAQATCVIHTALFRFIKFSLHDWSLLSSCLAIEPDLITPPQHPSTPPYWYCISLDDLSLLSSLLAMNPISPDLITPLITPQHPSSPLNTQHHPSSPLNTPLNTTLLILHFSPISFL